MTEQFDIAAPQYDKARRMLQTDLIAWFTTVGPDGKPHAVPVWFFWHDGRVLIFSEPGTVKVRHLREGSPVLVHLHAGGPFGDDVVILHGRAEVSDRGAASWLGEFRDAYAEKYAAAIKAYGMPLEAIPEKFSTALVFTPERLQAW
jgi:PPOX class probable F420-dependent enzyme